MELLYFNFTCRPNNIGHGHRVITLFIGSSKAFNPQSIHNPDVPGPVSPLPVLLLVVQGQLSPLPVPLLEVPVLSPLPFSLLEAPGHLSPLNPENIFSTPWKP